MIFDTHAHILDENLECMREEILADLEGMDGFCEVGYDYDSSMRAIKLAEQNDKVWANIGTHPQDAEKLTDEHIAEYKRLSSHPKVVAIGEIGLDYYYEDPPREVQKVAFEKQLQMACEIDLPICLHVRDSYQDTYELLSKYSDSLKGRILLHCYSGSAEMVKQFDKFDCYYALGGVVTFKNAKKDEVIQAIKPDRLVLETDCPYMTPVPFRGKLNKPSYVLYVAEKIASVTKEGLQEVIDRTTANAKRLYKKIEG